MTVKNLLHIYEHHFVFVITSKAVNLKRPAYYKGLAVTFLEENHTFSEIRILLLPTAPALLLEPTQSGGVPPPLQTRTVSSRGIWRRTDTRHL